ncbi:thymopoietin a isoform X2 [Electrophorus electricus]|uniref:thymopoietin a isoform X2 n=1 Tax=Electrophorus electricus TaxID=8005 RepID=UPI0015CFE54E|nr:thymopoietin a isoform X2 [Electrophorus electricus]
MSCGVGVHRKATKKTDRVPPEEMDVTVLTNEDLKDQLLKYGVSAGPIVASTRKVYEKRLQKLLDQGGSDTTPPRAKCTQTGSGYNGTTQHAEQYSDMEGETTPADPEPVPVVERPVRSRGKPSVTPRTLGSRHRIEKLSCIEQTPKVTERNVLKEMFSSESLNTPTGISATCRRPIKGAAGRPVSDVWLGDLRPRLTEIRRSSSSYTESRSVPRVSAVPFTPSRPMAPPAVQAKARRRVPVWVRLLLLSAVAGFLFLVYQAMETNEMSPFGHGGSNALDSK